MEGAPQKGSEPQDYFKKWPLEDAAYLITPEVDVRAVTRNRDLGQYTLYEKPGNYTVLLRVTDPLNGRAVEPGVSFTLT